MKKVHALCLSTSRVVQPCASSRSYGRLIKWRAFKRWQDLDREYKAEQKIELKKKNVMRINENLYISPENEKQVMPKKAHEDQTRRDCGALPMDFLTSQTQMRYLDHSFENLRRVKEYNQFQILQYDQRFIPERLLFLGADLAAAHFLVHRGAAVKFIGDDSWYRRDKKGNYSLPGRKVNGLYLEAIDASNTKLLFEGFDNLYDLKHVRMLRLAGCPYVNDWMLSRIGGIFVDSLEMLDLSGCDRISAKGLFALRSLKKLRYLRLEGLDDVKDVAQTSLILEEHLPGLKILGLDFVVALQSLQRELRLLEDDRSLIDAKGNVFCEDDNGRHFYVHGKVNERATVCDDDKPLMTSTIRRDVPAMNEVEFERIDRLSGGKLRHLLVGSPSGYSWTDQVETILSFEHQWNLRKKIATDAKLLPAEKRKDRLKALGYTDQPAEVLPGVEEKKQLESSGP
jgi:hypothetical protein